MRVKRIIKQKITTPKQKQKQQRKQYVKKKQKESLPLIPHYSKIKQMLIELQKVEDVVNIVKNQLKELESWKGKLEDTLCSYVNKNCEKSCKEIKREILRDIKNSKVNGEIKKQRKKGDDPSEVNYGTPSYNTYTKENIMNLHQTKGAFGMKANNKNIAPSNTSEGDNILTSAKLREANDHIKVVRVYSEKGFKNMYRCLICKKTLSQKQNCRLHIRRVHFGERLACPKCHSQFYEHMRLAEHRKTCLGNSSRTQDENTNIYMQKKRGRPAGVKKSKKSKVSYENVKVRNPFKNFSLSECLNVKVIMERLPVPDNLQNLIDESPQRTKRRLKLAAALEQSNVDFTKKRKNMNVFVNTQSVLPPSASSSFSYMPHQKMDGRKTSQKQRKKNPTVPFGLANFQFGQQFLPNPNIINPFPLPYIVKQEGVSIIPNLPSSSSSTMPMEEEEGEEVNEGEEVLPIVDGSYACILCNEFFPSASDLKMHNLLQGHPIASAASTVSLGFADVMNMNNGNPMNNYFPYQTTNPNNFNEFQDFSSQQQNFSNEFIPMGVPSYFINNPNPTFPSSSFTNGLTDQNQRRAPKKLTKKVSKKDELKFVNSKIREHVSEEETTFECLICSKLFSRRANVLVHVKRMHFGDRFRRICPGCSGNFYDTRSLTAHQSKCEAYKELTSGTLNDNVAEMNNGSSTSTT